MPRDVCWPLASEVEVEDEMDVIDAKEFLEANFKDRN